MIRCVVSGHISTDFSHLLGARSNHYSVLPPLKKNNQDKDLIPLKTMNLDTLFVKKNQPRSRYDNLDLGYSFSERVLISQFH